MNWEDKMQFLSDWQTWNPKRIAEAVQRPITCSHFKCARELKPIDALDLEHLRMNCPHCGEKLWICGDLSWDGGEMVCNDCGREAPTRFVEFSQNIGLVLLRLHKEANGNMCRDCIGKYFRPMTVTTLFMGWWGVISLFVTPFCIANNCLSYIRSRGLDNVPQGAVSPSVTEDDLSKLVPLKGDILGALSEGRKREDVARDFAERASLTPAQVMLLIQHLIKDHILNQMTALPHRERPTLSNYLKPAGSIPRDE